MDERSLEKKTIKKMIQLYCAKHHGSIGLCDDCRTLLTYSYERVHACPHWPTKPSCTKCLDHCYNRVNRMAIKRVMKYSGPRMIYHSPLLAVRHVYRSLNIRSQ